MYADQINAPNGDPVNKHIEEEVIRPIFEEFMKDNNVSPTDEKVPKQYAMFCAGFYSALDICVYHPETIGDVIRKYEK